MVLKRYIGKDVNEAFLKAKMDLGNEAVILNTRKIRQKGFWRLFSKTMVEVLVALEDTPKIKLKNDPIPTNTPTKTVGATPVVLPETTDSRKEHQKDEKIASLETKVSNMESLMQKVYLELKALPQKKLRENEPPDSGVGVNKLFYNNLIKSEIEQDIVKHLMDKVEEKLSGNAGVNDLARAVSGMIKEMLGQPETIKLREDGKPTVVIFIGPTGVGKTTTLAKIAANYALNEQKKVGLITADTYRIAAVDQLKTYADILNLPVSVVYSPQEVAGAIEKLSDKDIILIDTAGRSPKEKEQFEELKSLLTITDADEVYLVLSATSGISNCRDVINTYNFLEHYKLIFTKLDENPVYGILLNARHYTKKNLSYITIGQSVPDDIEVADTEKLTKNLLGACKDEGSSR